MSTTRKRRINSSRVINNSLLKQKILKQQKRIEELSAENSRLNALMSNFHVAHFRAVSAAKELIETFNLSVKMIKK